MARLRGLCDVISGPLSDIARRMSRYLAESWPHTALVIFTRECTGRPRKVAGQTEVVGQVTIEALEELKLTVPLGHHAVRSVRLSGGERWVWLVRDATDTLLVLFPRAEIDIPDPSGLAAVFGMVATSIRQQVAQAGPDYLAESRAASSARARTIDELTATHEATVAGILATLRSPRLDDRRARSIAADAASVALVAIRSTRAIDRVLGEERPAAAFTRLREEIVSLLRDRELDVEYVPPRADSPSIPGEVASGARAITKTAVLGLVGRGDSRLRIAWASDAQVLTVDVRDQGAGDVEIEALRRSLQGRVQALHAEAELESVPGWGCRVFVRLPLEPPVAAPDQTLLARLNPRQREVLVLVAMGKRNKVIADELGVAESTVKFHVAGVLKKLDVSTRGEAAALGVRAGLTPRPGVARGSTA